MRLSDLRDKKVKTLDGKKLGRIHEVHSEGGRVVALMCGAPSFIERLTAKTHGRRVRWEDVVRIDKDAVVIAACAKDQPNAPRTRQGTRRPSARPSTR